MSAGIYNINKDNRVFGHQYVSFCFMELLSCNRDGFNMLVSDFMSLFVRRLYEVIPEDAKRDLIKQDRTVKHALYLVMGKYQRLRKDLAISFQEKFHLKMDQLSADYRTWKRAGCKSYARPKQYVSGLVANASKKSFDYILGTYLLELKKLESEKIVSFPEAARDTNTFDELSEEAS